MLNIISYVGKTPIVKLQNIYDSHKAPIFIKLEEFNPGGSVKSRPGKFMVLDAHNRGMLNNKIILEATGGNTGLGITISAITLGYKVHLVIPDNFSREKIKTLENYGAKIILSDHTTGPGSHIRLLKDILEVETKYINLDQFSNPVNPLSHYLTTGPEIINQLDTVKVDAFIAGIGSGGTLMGVGKYLKEICNNTKIIGVQPEECDFLNGRFFPHKIEAIAVGLIPPIVDLNMIDKMISVNYEEVMDLRNWLSKKNGLFVGISSGANILAAFKEATNYKKDKIIVTIAPDSGKSYMED